MRVYIHTICGYHGKIVVCDRCKWEQRPSLTVTYDKVPDNPDVVKCYFCGVMERTQKGSRNEAL